MYGVEVTVYLPETLRNEIFAEGQQGDLEEIDEKYQHMATADPVTLWAIQACIEKAVREGQVEDIDPDDFEDVYQTVAGTVQKFEKAERDEAGRFR